MLHVFISICRHSALCLGYSLQEIDIFSNLCQFEVRERKAFVNADSHIFRFCLPVSMHPAVCLLSGGEICEIQCLMIGPDTKSIFHLSRWSFNTSKPTVDSWTRWKFWKKVSHCIHGLEFGCSSFLHAGSFNDQLLVIELFSSVLRGQHRKIGGWRLIG